jgi:hypothetical protein
MNKITRKVIAIVILAIFLIPFNQVTPAASARNNAAAVKQPSIEPAAVSSGGDYRLTTITGQTGHTSSGGDYRLTNTTVDPAQTSTGGAYRLLGSQAPASSENGCCCVYVPCVVRDN